MCIAEGFPSVPFLVDTDLSREDGIVQCRHITEAEVLSYGWKIARAVVTLLRGPIPW